MTLTPSLPISRPAGQLNSTARGTAQLDLHLQCWSYSRPRGKDRCFHAAERDLGLLGGAARECLLGRWIHSAERTDRRTQGKQMLDRRRELYKEIERIRSSNLIAYVTGDRQGRETKIAPDAVDKFGEVLDELPSPKPRISLLLYTRGGDTSAAWSLVNLLREFTDDLEVIVPSRCLSSGTLICLGANRIFMAKQATLGPIDPSVTHPLNPQIPGANARNRLPLSVEDVAGYMDLAREEGGIDGDQALASVFGSLASEVHPVALGSVKRARAQIQELARKLLSKHMTDAEKREKIVKMLCNEAGSHDYSIYRSEARKELGFEIESPSVELYNLMKEWALDIRSELELDVPYNPGQFVAPGTTGTANYRHVRGVIETANNGAYHFVSSGRLLGIQLPDGNFGIRDEPNSEGWVKA